MTKRKIIWTFLAGVLVLFAAIAIPNFVPARFESSGEDLAVRVLVTDQEHGTPIEGATVSVPRGGKSVTGPDGRCEAMARFSMSGVAGRSAKMHLHGTMQVAAPGYRTWERPFVSLFGPSYDYFRNGTSVVYAVTLAK